MARNDLLVRGGDVVDGTGAPAVRADVRVRGGRIVEIGARLRPDGEEEFDASGAVVTPGFIDTHAHVDPQVFWDASLDPEPQHGVTTLLVGNCSLSLYPVSHGDQRRAVRPVRLYRGRAPPPLRRLRAVDLVRLRRLSRHGQRHRLRAPTSPP